MTRFQPKINERGFPWGRVIFSSSHHITVITPAFTIIFHRFGAARGNYTKSWQRFRKELTRRKLESVYDIYKYANYYEVTSFVKGTNLGNGSSAKLEEKK